MPAKVKPAHYRGSYHVESRRVRQAANANPNTRCWRCNRTLAEVRLTKPRAIWTAGHIIDGMTNGPLAPECSPCNYSNGGKLGNRRARNNRQRTPRTW